MGTRTLAFLALLSMYLALPIAASYAAPDAGVVAVVAPPTAPPTAPVLTPPVTSSTTTTSTVTTGKTPMLADYTVLIGGVFLGAAFFVRKFTTGWFHTEMGGFVIVLVSAVLTSCGEAVQNKGFSKSVIVAAAGQAILTFFVMENAKKTTNNGDATKAKLKLPTEEKKS